MKQIWIHGRIIYEHILYIALGEKSERKHKEKRGLKEWVRIWGKGGDIIRRTPGPL